MQKKLSKASLMLWLGVLVVSLALIIGGWISNGYDSIKSYVWIPPIALMMYLFRLFLHKRIKD